MLKEGVRLDRVRGGRQKYRRQSTTPVATQAISVQAASQPIPQQQQSVATTTAVNNSYYHHHHHHHHHLSFNNNFNNKITDSENYHQHQQFSHQMCSKGNKDKTTFDGQHRHHLLSNSGDINGWNNNNNDVKGFSQQCCSNSLSGVDSVRECGKFFYILYA